VILDSAISVTDATALDATADATVSVANVEKGFVWDFIFMVIYGHIPQNGHKTNSL
jgi:hypothetical protein